VYVRELEDGSLEVLTGRRGVLGRHCVSADGSAELVQARARDWRWWRGLFVLGAAFVLFVVYGIVGFALTDTPTSDAPWWVIIPTFLGFCLFVPGLMLLPGPHSLTRGERPGGLPPARDPKARWARVGFEE